MHIWAKKNGPGDNTSVDFYNQNIFSFLEWVSQFCRQLAWTTNKIWRVLWEALCWWEAWGLGPLGPLKSGPGLGSKLSWRLKSRSKITIFLFNSLNNYEYDYGRSTDSFEDSTEVDGRRCRVTMKRWMVYWMSWRRSIVVRTLVSAGELSLSAPDS